MFCVIFNCFGRVTVAYFTSQEEARNRADDWNFADCGEGNVELLPCYITD